MSDTIARLRCGARFTLFFSICSGLIFQYFLRGVEFLYHNGGMHSL